MIGGEKICERRRTPYNKTVRTSSDSHMNLDDLHWHDGNITKFELIPNYGGKSQLLIEADIYDDSVRTPGRSSIILKCLDVSRFNCSCDMIELNDNSGAGDINYCSQKGLMLGFHLFGGFIEIEARKFHLEKC